MSKTTTNNTREISKLDPEKINESLNRQHLTGETVEGITKDAAFDYLESLKDNQLEELTAEYFEFETKGTYHFIFNGMTTMTVEDKQRPGTKKEMEVVMIEDKEGHRYINGNTVLVTSLNKVQNLPCMIRVNYVGDVEAKGGGKYKDLRVMTFPMPRGK